MLQELLSPINDDWCVHGERATTSSVGASFRILRSGVIRDFVKLFYLLLDTHGELVLAGL